MAKKEITTFDADLLAGFASDGEKAAAELQGGGRFSPPYIRVTEIREGKTTKSVVEVVNPVERDDNNKSKVTRFDSLNVVLMNHTMTRAVKYNGADGKMHTESFGVGPKRDSIVVGKLAGGVAYLADLEARNPEGWNRNVIEYGTDQVTSKMVKHDSRYFAVVALPEEAHEAAGGELAMMFLSMTSTYGVMIKDAADAADRSMTLLSYPDRSDPGDHKGVLHQLLTREWELGTKGGLEVKGTPQTAIWLTVEGVRLGDVNVAVPAFTIADELDQDELRWVAGLKQPAFEMMANMITQNVKDAAPEFAAARLEEFGRLAAKGEFGDAAQTARLALPSSVEVVDEDEELPESEDLGVVNPVAAPPPSVEDEFPPDLPF